MLEPILASVRRRLPEVIDRLDELKAGAAQRAITAAVRDFEGALSLSGISVVAEIKRRSPSRGVLDERLVPDERAKAYEEGGAAAISVLTEPDHFGGSPQDLQIVREAVALPVLRKDFILHPAQVWESAAMGADALLLIVGALTDDELGELLQETAVAGLTALVEVHSLEEAKRAVALNPSVVGVNNRDLLTFNVDLATAEAIAPLLSGVPGTVAESGIFNRADAQRMSHAGFDAVLVGESLVRSGDPATLVAELRQVGT